MDLSTLSRQARLKQVCACLLVDGGRQVAAAAPMTTTGGRCGGARRFVMSLLMVVLVSMGAARTAHAADDVVLTQDGHGGSLAEARQDAIRQALQKVIPQIVVSDRRIESDQLVYDRLMSSLEGHVKAIEQLQVRADPAAGVVARYRMVISPKEIENFVKLSAGGSARLNGALIADTLSTELEARDFKGRYLERLFRGYPGYTVDTRVVSVKPGVQDPNLLDVVLQYQLNPKWLKALMAGARNLACTSDERGQCAPKALCLADSYLHLAPGVRKECVPLAPGPDRGDYPVIGNLGLRSSEQLYLLIYFEDAGGRHLGQNFCVITNTHQHLINGFHDRELVLVQGHREVKAQIDVSTFREQLKATSHIRVFALSNALRAQGANEVSAGLRRDAGLTATFIDPQASDLVSQQACTWIRPLN